MYKGHGTLEKQTAGVLGKKRAYAALISSFFTVIYSVRAHTYMHAAGCVGGFPEG